MAEKKPSYSKLNRLHGIVISSQVDSGKIAEVRMPELDSNFILISTRDIPGTNRVRVLDESMPLLTSSQISYKEQPILALFGFDSESVQLKSKEIEILLQQEEQTPLEEPETEKNPPVLYKYGDMEKILATEGLLSLKRSYHFADTQRESNDISRISAEMEDDRLHIYTPTQWPSHVRDTVSEVTSFPKKKITIHKLPFYAPHDEMLINPSVLSSIAAVACLKGNCPVEIQSRISNLRPIIDIERKSWYLPEGRVLAEQIEVKVIQGFVTLFSEEMAKQLIAGLTPLYQLDALTIAISFETASFRPAHFYGDLGYSDALACTEAHYSVLAKTTGYSPALWRVKYAIESTGHTQIIKSEKYTRLKEILSDTCLRCDFQRKNAAYEMQTQMRVKMSTFFNYSRGIAVACGPGIGGFSSDCGKLPQQAVQIQLNPNDKVECNTSFYTIGSSADIWKQIICEELSVEKENISFATDEKDLIDSGPSVLSANSGRMPLQIQRACAQVREKRFLQPLPICETVTNNKLAGKNPALFLSNNWVTVALELEIDTVTLQPLVRNVWLTIATGRIFDEQSLRSKIRHIVVTTLREDGALLSSGKSFSIDIKLIGDGEQISSSFSSALKGIVTATFLSALEQALGSNIPKIPVTGDSILTAMRGKG
ncbi:molybdopterin cofactor-binding domain-containing protein [uncultured Sphaerochaeta sp.]|uniref:molybdopterin cofactor-binding domain-containing protein n=1 Tax=uncultured Sphaerochaeta sp. TaxID=886478 RepID=UPI002A0A9976|nr:molybdopterin cofactor-binding domain-containing protein [uncultured Sphaerochaeta sp.]